MKVVIVPALQDNYSYLIVDEGTSTAAVVDPVEPDTVAAAAKKEGVKLVAVLTTHNHWDHAGGNKKMASMFKGIRIYGGKGDDADAVTDEVDDDSKITLGDVIISVLFTPCHTPGHVCYVAHPGDGSPDGVFTGDTLFIGGCGNFNSGTPAQMHEALNTKLAGLAGKTKVYCGHEYTVTNLTYALTVEPENKAIAEKLAWATKRRKDGYPTIPSTIEEELATNPFMRVTEKTVKAYTGKSNPVDVIAVVRREKTAWGRSRSSKAATATATVAAGSGKAKKKKK